MLSCDSEVMITGALMSADAASAYFAADWGY